MSSDREGDIAVVGMAGRFPGAPDLAAYQTLLETGSEGIQDLDEETLRAAGEASDRWGDPAYVRRAAPAPDFDHFDAELFGFSPKDAAIADPQHRIFLETAWQALEDAGWDPARFEGSTGLFAGCGEQAYFRQNVMSRPDLVEEVGHFLLRHTANDKDFLVTRVAYLLNLQGPAISVQTACSTSLVAIHLACQSLLAEECDMALAGGVTIDLPANRGYLPRAGEILSPDGRVRTFDADAQGTVFGSGAGVVVLRRLSDAMEDRDRIHAVIRGSAVNNDGARKVGYLAPSVEGQAAAIAEAHALADVPPSTVGLVECHGTGTAMGDPIEVEALRQVYGTSGSKHTRLGAVKTQIGHLDTAAGVAGFIKAVLSVKTGRLYGNLHFKRPNPALNLEASPFVVPTRTEDWAPSSTPRRAAVNSLGVGGTNAYILLEEAPAPPSRGTEPKGLQVLVLTGRSRQAVNDLGERLQGALSDSTALADVSHTLLRGRQALSYRRVLAAASASEARDLLASKDPNRVFDHVVEAGRPVAFLFSGGGSHHAGMGKDLLEIEPVFREWMERAHEALSRWTDFRLLDAIRADKPLEVMAEQLPALYAVSYAVARAWMARGVEPQALLGHSVGENTAAALAGVFSFEDGLQLVFRRGCLFDRLPAGGMTSVALPPAELMPYMSAGLDLSVVNAPELCCVSGPQEELERLEAALSGQEVEHRRLAVPVAAHSRYLEPILKEFGDFVRSIERNPPRIPIASNLTGDWLTNEDAVRPEYWVDHLRNPVRFADGVRRILEDSRTLAIEVGPGRSLASLARRQGIRGAVSISSLPHADEPTTSGIAFRTALGRAWATGVDFDLHDALHGGEERRIVDLPTYPFQRARHWIDAKSAVVVQSQGLERLDAERWIHQTRLREEPAHDPVYPEPGTVWIFEDEAGLAAEMGDRLETLGHRVIRIVFGDGYASLGPHRYSLAPEQGLEGYRALVEDLVAEGLSPDRVIHAWSVTREVRYRPGSSFFHRNLECGFYSLLFLAQCLSDERLSRPIDVVVWANGVWQAPGEDLEHPEKVMVTGPVQVMPRELEGVTCRGVDLQVPTDPGVLGLLSEKKDRRILLEQLERELFQPLDSDGPEPRPAWVVLRDGRRFGPTQVRTGLKGPVERVGGPLLSLDANSTVLVTGGLGGVGLEFVEYLLQHHPVSVAICSRSAVPSRDRWAKADAPAALQRLARLDPEGRRTHVFSADVTDIEALQQGIQEASLRLGPIRGVVHTAGVLRDGLMLQKSQSDCEDVFAPKVFGTLVLERALADHPLQFFTIFGSSSVWIAPAGQADYVAANAFVEAFARSRHRPDRPVQVVHWGVWHGVGLARRALDGNAAGPSGPRKAIEHPLLSVGQSSPKSKVATGWWLPEEQWVLDQHRSRDGRAVLPGTAYAELISAAVRAFDSVERFTIEDLYFSRPLEVADDTAKEVQVELRPTAQGYQATVRSRRNVDGREGLELHATAQLSLSEPSAPPTQRPLESLGPERTELQSLPAAAEQAKHVRFGPRWNVVRKVWRHGNVVVGELEMDPAFHDPDYFAHSGLFDAATGLGLEVGETSDHREPGLWVPVSYRGLRFLGRLGPRCWARVESLTPGEDGTTEFRLELRDEDGQLLLGVDRIAMRRISDGLSSVLDRPLGESEWQPLETGGGGAPGKDPGRQLLEETHRLGIRPEEGTVLWERALRAGLAPAVHIGSIDLNRLAQRTHDAAQQAQNRARPEGLVRPELDSDFVEPRDGVERTLAGMWQDLLGVKPVGVRDGFFELGGHSLVAVRLFAQIRRTFDVDLPISVLFEAPNIERCAELIRGQRSDEPQQRDRKGRFLHLVPMQDESRSPKTPFFLVAGMFGNVLNLRHLAHQLEDSRPVYGLQARGLFGDTEPHETFEEMARDYIEEIRQVQPSGPYLLGGFSGGGITAWEMSRQLREANEEVAVLVLLDSRVPKNPELTGRERAELQLQNLRRRGPSYVAEWAQRRVRWELSRWTGPDAEPVQPGRFQNEEIEKAFRRALERYDVPYLEDVPVLLYRPRLDPMYRFSTGRMTDPDRTFLFEDNGWGPHCRLLKISEVPGDHDSMVLQPNVRVLANRLRAAFDQADRSLGVISA